MKRITRMASVASASVALLVGLATTAQATQVEKFSYHEDLTGTRSCANGLQLQTHNVNDGSVLVIARGNGTFDYAMEHMDLHVTVTNIANGESYTVWNHGVVFKDLRYVTDADGTVHLYVNSPAPITIWGPDGKVAYRSAGMDVYEFVLVGEDFEFVGVVKSAGLRDLVGNTCDTAASFWL